MKTKWTDGRKRNGETEKRRKKIALCGIIGLRPLQGCRPKNILVKNENEGYLPHSTQIQILTEVVTVLTSPKFGLKWFPSLLRLHLIVCLSS